MKRIRLLLTTFLLVSCFMLITSCAKPLTDTKSEEYFTSSEQKLGYEVVSSIQMLPESFVTRGLAKNASGNMQEKNEQVTKTETVVEEESIQKYLNLMDNLLNENGGFSSTKEDSDDPSYQYKLSITTRTVTGETVSYVIYYNETEVIEDDAPDVENDFHKHEHEYDKDKKEDESHKHDDEEDDEDNEVETVYQIEGIAYFNDEIYTVIGKREYEVEDDETESKFTLKISLDEQNYVIVQEEQEVEDCKTESEYMYKVFENSKLASSVSMVIKEKNNKTEIKLKEMVPGQELRVYKFYISNVDGVKIINVMVNNKDDSNYTKHVEVTISYDVETDNYKYNYRYNKGNKK